ncbi:MAG: DUF4397 domain-containing protein [Planctomycetaceae bacterium]|nr:DUF4397 domain-containing protein [Planctomycetaceae bacterium]
MVRNWSRWAVALLTIVAAWGVAPQDAAAQFTNGELYFGQGLPGDDLDNMDLPGTVLDNMDLPNSLPLDVCVGIEGTGALNCVFSGVRFGNFRGPLSLPSGVYQVTAAPANPQNPGANTPILSGTVAIRARQSFTFVAHLSTTGTPIGTGFQNTVDRIVPIKSRVVARHAANAAPVDIALVSQVGMPGMSALGLTNSTQSAASDLMSGPFTVSMKPAGNPFVNLVTPFNLTLAPLNGYYLYAVGSVENGTLQLLVQRVPLKIRFFP